MLKSSLPGPYFTRLYLDDPVGLSKEEYERLWSVMRKPDYPDFLSYEQGLITLKFLDNESVFGVMPTSGGKTFTFQTVARMTDGLTIVISPLISLMADQVRKHPYGTSFFYNSSFDPTRREEVKRRIREGKLKVLYTSPEQLKSSGFKALLRVFRGSKKHRVTHCC